MQTRSIIPKNKQHLSKQFTELEGGDNLPPIYFNDTFTKKMLANGGLEKLQKIMEEAKLEHQKMMAKNN